MMKNCWKVAVRALISMLLACAIVALLATSCTTSDDVTFEEDVVPALRLEGTWFRTEIGEKVCAGNNEILDRRPVDRIVSSLQLLRDQNFVLENFGSDDPSVTRGTYTAFEIPMRNDSYDLTLYRDGDIWFSCIATRRDNEIVLFDYRLPDGTLECVQQQREGYVDIYSLQL